MVAFCVCGAALGENARFCRSCGQPVESATPAPVSPSPLNSISADPPVSGVGPVLTPAGFPVPPHPPPAPPSPPSLGGFHPASPLPPAPLAPLAMTPLVPLRIPSFPCPPPLAAGPSRPTSRARAHRDSGPGATSAGGLPPAPEPWEFQQKTVAMADSVLASFVKPGTAAGAATRVFERMVRGCLLDQQSARAAAEDESSSLEAWMALALVFAVGALGPYLIFFTLPSLSQLLMIVALIGIQLVSFAAGVALASSLLPSMAGVRLTFGQVFRALTYAQSVGILGIITALAAVFSIWRIVTSVAAIRAVTGCDTGKAVVVLIIAAIGSFGVSAVLSPILMIILVF
jgi:hypothetical protein